MHDLQGSRNDDLPPKRAFSAADDISIMTEDNNPRSMSASSSKSTKLIGAINPLSTLKISRNPFRKSYKDIDNVSVSPSLCSDVLRDPGKAMGLSRSHHISDASMSAFTYNHTNSYSTNDSVENAEDAARREERKHKIREKIERYKQRELQLKQSNAALASQLMATTEKLKEVDYQAASKIDVLEQELHDTRLGMTEVVHRTQKQQYDQTDCIKDMGKKLIRQAKIIKRQKKAIEQYNMQLDGLREEMAMQDERDLDRDAQFQAQLDDFEKIAEQKVAMQHSLQENIEEMMDLKQEKEASAQRIMELEFDLQQKDATLARVAKETSEKAERICALEEELEEKSKEADVIQAELKASEKSLQMMMEKLEKSNEEVEELRCKFAGWGESGAAARSPPSSMAESPSAAAEAERRRTSLFSLRGVGKSNHGVAGEAVDISFWQEQINERDDQIHQLDSALKEKEEESQKLRSDMVKMSSTYKNDDYLKRKQIAKLKQENAEYALKLRALEKAFKAVNGDGSTNPVASDIGSSLHALNGRISKSMHSPMSNSSLHGSKHSTHSTHSTNSSKEERKRAAFARVGVPYHQLSHSRPTEQQAIPNGSLHGSEDGRKREETGEC
ncbi:hypothetical protein ACHAXM_006856 [Skeletonema potamos]